MCFEAVRKSFLALLAHSRTATIVQTFLRANFWFFCCWLRSHMLLYACVHLTPHTARPSCLLKPSGPLCCRYSIACTLPCQSSPATTSMRALFRTESLWPSGCSQASTSLGPSPTSPCCSTCNLARRKSASLAPPTSTGQVGALHPAVFCRTMQVIGARLLLPAMAGVRLGNLVRGIASLA